MSTHRVVLLLGLLPWAGGGRAWADELQVTPAVLLAGEQAEVTVLKGGALPSRSRVRVHRRLEAPYDAWSVREGELQPDAAGRVTFRAPTVSVATWFTFQVLEPGLDGAPLAGSVQVRPRLQVAMADGAKRCLVAGNQARLRVSRLDGEALGDLHWQVLGLAGEGLAVQGPEAVFTAPPVAAPHRVRFRVRDAAHPEDLGEASLQVLPALEGLPDLLAETVLPSVLGEDWLTPVPALTGLGGGDLRWPRALAFVEDPRMGELDRHWLVGDLQGLMALSCLDPAPVLLDKDLMVSAIAVRPREADPGAPPVVFAQAQAEPGDGVPTWGLTGPASWNLGSCLRGLGPEGEAWTLAGVEQVVPGDPLFRDGPAALARFGAITALAVDGSGTVFVADAGNQVIRRLTRDGMVRTLTELGFLRLGEEASLGVVLPGLSGLALHPTTGDLFVTCALGLLRLAQDGQAATLIGGAPRLALPGVCCRCLRRFKGVALHRDHLVVLMDGPRTLLAYHLGTGVQTTLLAKEGTGTRMGPLSAPQVPAGACATLHHAAALAVNAEGGCLLALDDGLAHLDLASALARETPFTSRSPSPRCGDRTVPRP